MTEAFANPINGVAGQLCKLPEYAHEFACRPISMEWLAVLLLLAIFLAGLVVVSKRG